MTTSLLVGETAVRRKYAIDTASEDWRRICEARHHLRQCCPDGDMAGSGPAVHAKLAEIAKVRGKEAAEALRGEMRVQARCMADWWNQEGGE